MQWAFSSLSPPPPPVGHMVAPSTPDILVSGTRRPDHCKHPHLQFGHVWLVTMLDVKRAAVASALCVSLKDTEKSEIGVCLGFSYDTPGAYDFLLANGSAFPRRVVEIVNLTPFDWILRKIQFADLEIPSVTPVPSGNDPVAQSVVQNSLPLSVR